MAHEALTAGWFPLFSRRENKCGFEVEARD
jgi:hypothetical protein